MAETSDKTNIIAWVSIVISIVALILGFTAYNRSGTDLEQQAANQAVDVRQEIARQLAIAEVRARLMILETRLNAGLGRDEAAREIAENRADLKDMFTDAQGETKANWQRIDTDLAQLETKLRQGSADALQSLESIIRNLRNAVATD